MKFIPNENGKMLSHLISIFYCSQIKINTQYWYVFILYRNQEILPCIIFKYL